MSERELRARAYELAAGVSHPREADGVRRGAGALGRAGRAEGRALDDARAARARAADACSVARRALARARRAGRARRPCARRVVEVQREIGGPLSAEQREALETITGDGGVSVLVGQAGTGKGVVIAAAAERLAARGLSGDRHRGGGRDGRAPRRRREARALDHDRLRCSRASRAAACARRKDRRRDGRGRDGRHPPPRERSSR